MSKQDIEARLTEISNKIGNINVGGIKIYKATNNSDLLSLDLENKIFSINIHGNKLAECNAPSQLSTNEPHHVIGIRLVQYEAWGQCCCILFEGNHIFVRQGYVTWDVDWIYSWNSEWKEISQQAKQR